LTSLSLSHPFGLSDGARYGAIEEKGWNTLLPAWHGFLMTELQICLLGQISVQQDGQQVRGIPPKALELLCYLLLHRERSHTREALAAAFWPDTPDSLSRKYLRQALWRLGTKLSGQGREESEGLLIVKPGWIRVNQKALGRLDVAEFEQAYRLYRDIPGAELTDSQVKDLESAVALYGGDLIEAWYQEWCVLERNRLELGYLTMLEQLMSYCGARQNYAKGIAYGQYILRREPARENTHRHLMRLYYQAGDRTTALRQYDRCAEAMAKHFDLEPSRETVSLYHLLRAEGLADSPRPAPAAANPEGELLRGLQARLDQIQASLADLECQVRQQLARSTECRLDVRRVTPAHPG
jgi:DNA-binding SARP family transcriptional activator